MSVTTKGIPPLPDGVEPVSSGALPPLPDGVEPVGSKSLSSIPPLPDDVEPIDATPPPSLVNPDGSPVGEKYNQEATDAIIKRRWGSSTARRTLGDAGVALAKGIVGVPETVVGLADIPTMGLAGKGLEKAGIRFKETQEALSNLYSPEARQAQERVGEGFDKGITEGIKSIVKNPSTIMTGAVESTPTMFGGGAIAKGLGMATKIAPVLAGAIGEGAVTAGQNIEQVRQETDGGMLTPAQVALNAASGALTGALGVFGGKIAQRLGIADIDTLMAGGKSVKDKRSVLMKAIGGMVSEGLLEELPQSIQEQIAQNLSLGKPWDAGVAQSGAMGSIIGGIMGAGANVANHGIEQADRAVRLTKAQELRKKILTQRGQRDEAAKIDLENLNDTMRRVYARGIDAGLTHEQAMEVIDSDDPDTTFASLVSANQDAERIASEESGRGMESAQLAYPDVTNQLLDHRFNIYMAAGYDRATAIRMVQEDQQTDPALQPANLNDQPISTPDASPIPSIGTASSPVSTGAGVESIAPAILQAAGVQDATGDGARVVEAQIQAHVETGAPIDAQPIADATGSPVDVGALADAINDAKQSLTPPTVEPSSPTAPAQAEGVTISPSEPVASSIQPLADTGTRTEAETGKPSYPHPEIPLETKLQDGRIAYNLAGEKSVEMPVLDTYARGGMKGDVKKAKAYLASQRAVEDAAIRDMIRGETLPELNRLYKAFPESPSREGAIESAGDTSSKPPELMTPEEWRADTVEKLAPSNAILKSKGFSGETQPNPDVHRNQVLNAMINGGVNRPVSADAVEKYGLQKRANEIGYTREGDRYVYSGETDRNPADTKNIEDSLYRVKGVLSARGIRDGSNLPNDNRIADLIINTFKRQMANNIGVSEVNIDNWSKIWGPLRRYLGKPEDPKGSATAAEIAIAATKLKSRAIGQSPEQASRPGVPNAGAEAETATTEPLFSDTYKGPRYTYGMRYRPLDIGAQPKGWIIDSQGPATERFRYGTIQYPRQLTADEVKSYELEEVKNETEGRLTGKTGDILSPPERATDVGSRPTQPSNSDDIQVGDEVLVQNPSRPGKPYRSVVRAIRQLPDDAEPMAEINNLFDKEIRVPISSLTLHKKSVQRRNQETASRIREQDEKQRMLHSSPTNAEQLRAKVQGKKVDEPAKTAKQKRDEFLVKNGEVKVVENASGDTTISVPSKDKAGLPMKEQKKYLLAEIDKAIDGAESDIPKKFLADRKRVEDVQALSDSKNRHKASSGLADLAMKYLNRSGFGGSTAAATDYRLTELINAINEAGAEASDKVTIEVPGDGEYTLVNIKKTLEAFKAKVGRDFPSMVSAKQDTPPRPKKDAYTEKDLVEAMLGNADFIRQYRIQVENGAYNDADTAMVKRAIETVKTKYGMVEPDQPKPPTPLAALKEKLAGKTKATITDATPEGYGPAQDSAPETIEERLPGESLDDAIARKVSYQIENGLVKLTQDKDGWTGKYVTAGGGQRTIKSYRKQQVLNELFDAFYPNTKLIEKKESKPIQDFALTAHRMTDRGSRMGEDGIEWNVNGDNIEVLHYVTGREYGTINLNTQELLPKRTEDRQILERVLESIVKQGEKYTKESELASLRQYPFRNREAIKRLESELGVQESNESETFLEVNRLADEIEEIGKKEDADNLRIDARRYEGRDEAGLNTTLEYAKIQLSSLKNEDTIAPGVSPSDIPLDLATRAHNGTSMTPEVRGRGVQRDYVMHMNAVWRELMNAAKTPEQKQLARDEFGTYRQNYVNRERDLLHSHSSIVSTFIAGGSGFPARAMNKRNDAYGKRLNDIVEWDKRAQSAMMKKIRDMAQAARTEALGGPIGEMEHRIAEAEKLQERMKAANAIIRKKGISDSDKVSRMVSELGFSESTARKAMEKDFAGRIGFADYQLTNNNARIRDMRQRLEILKRKESQKGNDPIRTDFDGGYVLDNPDADRIQIFHDKKPPSDVISKLKANGFRWSPSEEAWQRQRTDNTRYAVERVLGIKLNNRPTDKGVAMYSKPEQGNGMDVGDVRMAIRDLEEQHGIKANINADGENAGEQQGDRIVMNANQISNADHARRVYREELVHLGIRSMTPDEWRGLMDSVFQLKRAEYQAIEAKVREQYPEYNNDPAAMREEIIAHIGQIADKPGLWGRFIAAVRKFLRERGWVKTMTDNDVDAMVSEAFANVDKSKRMDQSNANESGDSISPRPITGRSVLAEDSRLRAVANKRVYEEALRLLQEDYSTGKGAFSPVDAPIESQVQAIRKVLLDVLHLRPGDILDTPPQTGHFAGGGEMAVHEGRTPDTVTKVFIKYHGGTGTIMRPEVSSDLIQSRAVLGTPLDMLERIHVLSSLGGTPTEIRGITDDGRLIVEQPRGSEMDSLQKVNQEIDRMNVVELPLDSYRAPSEVRIWVGVVGGNAYFITDLRKQNFVSDTQGRARSIDLAIGRITPAMIADNEVLRKAVDEATSLAEGKTPSDTKFSKPETSSPRTDAERQLYEILGIHEHGVAQGKEEGKTLEMKKLAELKARIKARQDEARAKQAGKINELRVKAGLEPRKNPTIKSAVEVGKAEEQEKGRMMSLEYSVDKAFRAQAKERGAGAMEWLERSAEHLAILDDQLKNLNGKESRGIIEDALKHVLGEDGARLSIRAAKHNVNDVLKYVREVLDAKLTGAHRKALAKVFDQYYQQQEGIPNPRMDKLTDEAKTRAAALLDNFPTAVKVGVKVADLKGIQPKQLKEWFNEWREIMATNRLDREVRIGRESFLAAQASSKLVSEVSKNHEPMVSSGVRPKNTGTFRDAMIDFFANQSLLAQRAFGGLKSLGHELFYRSLEAGENDYKAQKHKAQSALSKELERLGVSFMKKAAMMTELKPVKAGDQTIMMTDAERMHLAAFVGIMEDGKVTGGRLIARHHILRDGFIRESLAGTTAKVTSDNMPGLVSDIIKTLTPTEKAIVRKIVEIQTGMGEAGNKVSRQLLGRALFTEDWYMGMKPERIAEINADELGTAQAAQKFLENSGFTKTVVEHSMPVKIGNIFAAFDEHVDGMSRYIGLTIPLRNIRTAMKANDSALTRVINSSVGTDWTRRVTQTMMKLAGARNQDQHGPVKVLSTLSGNVMRSILAWNPSSYFNNRVPGAIMLAAAIAEKYPKAASKIIAGLAVPTQIKTKLNPIPLTRFGEENERIRAYLMEHGYLGDRWDDDYSSIASPVNRDVASQLKGKAQMVIRHISNVALNPMMHAEIRNGIDAFKALKAEGLSDEQARQVVADATRATQNSSSPLDDGAFTQGVRDFGLGGLFPFLSQNVVTRNFLLSNIADGDKKGAALAVAGIAASIAGTVLFRSLMRAIRNGPDDDEEKANEERIINTLNQAADTILPGVGIMVEPMLNSAFGQYRSGGSLIFERQLGEVSKLAGKIVSGKPVDADSAAKFIKAMTQLLGLPTGGLYSIGNVAHGIATGYEPDNAREAQDRTHALIMNSAKRLPDYAGPSMIRGEAIKLYGQAKREGLIKSGTSFPEFKKRYEAAFKRLNP